MSKALLARYGAIQLEIDRLKLEAADIRKRLSGKAQPLKKTWSITRGAVKATADRLGLKHSTVKAVVAGRSVSARVSAAYAEECAMRKAAAPKVAFKPLTPAQISETRHGGKYFGLYSRASRRCDLTVNSIRKAAFGVTRSQIALRALHEEIAEFEANPLPSHAQFLTAKQRAEFRPGGRYYGAYARVARMLGVSSGTVHGSASGTHKSQPTLRALHAEMARIDGVIAVEKERAE